MSKRNQIILAIGIIIFVPAFIIFLIGVNSGKIPAKYSLLFQFLMLIIITLAAIDLIIKLYKEKSKLWILETIILLFMFFWIFCSKGLIKGISEFVYMILLSISIIKLSRWQKNKNLIKK